MEDTASAVVVEGTAAAAAVGCRSGNVSSWMCSSHGVSAPVSAASHRSTPCCGPDGAVAVAL